MFKKIYIEITNMCNLKCKFCPDTKRKKEFIKVEDFEEIIKKVHKYTNLVCLHVKGEPLLHPKIEDILKVLEKYNLKANITTNGTLIKDNLDILKKSKAVRQINISIHSITQNNNLDEEYLENIFETAESLKDKIISYRLWNIKSKEDISENKKILSILEDYYNIKSLEETLRNKDFIKIRENLFINQDIEFVWPNVEGKEIIEAGRCLALKEQIAVLVDGTVVPCCLDNNGDINLGNIIKQDFKEILNNPKTQLIKKNFENRIITCNICKTCGFLQNLEGKRNFLY